MTIKPTDDDADFKMMSTPDEWPKWPFLPIKQIRPPKFPRTALLFNPSTGDDTSFLLMDRTLFDKLTDLQIAQSNALTPEKIRELVDEGWIVD